MSRKSRRLSPTSRDDRRATLKLKRASEPWVWPDSVWPDVGYQIGVGSFSSVSDGTHRKPKKHPLGFAAPVEEEPGAG